MMRYCEKCGAQVREEDGFCAVCDAKSKERDQKVEKIEKQVADFYNKNHLISEDSGKYIVRHEETEVFGNICRVVVRFLDDEDTPVADVSTNMKTGECSIVKRSPQCKQESEEKTGKNGLCIVLVLCAAVLWLFFPFVASDIFTIGDQTSALNIALGNFIHIGALDRYLVFWLAIWVGIGIVICLICLFCKAGGTAKLFAFLTLGFPALVVVSLLASEVEVTALFSEYGGIGFWGIIILMFIVACVSEKQR